MTKSINKISMKWRIAHEGMKIFSRNIKVKIHGYKKYEGNDVEICTSVVNSCYDEKKQYFMSSNGNYKVFY